MKVGVRCGGRVEEGQRESVPELGGVPVAESRRKNNEWVPNRGPIR